MVVAMQLGFEDRSLGFPRRIGRDEVVAVLLSSMVRRCGQTARRVESVEISHSATMPGHV